MTSPREYSPEWTLHVYLAAVTRELQQQEKGWGLSAADRAAVIMEVCCAGEHVHFGRAVGAWREWRRSYVESRWVGWYAQNGW